MAYRSEDRSDQWKAAVAVVLVHVALGAVIITGLNVEIISRAVERLETFDIALPEDPPPPPPPPPPRQAQEDEGAPAAPKASPVVAPKPEVRLPVRNSIAAAPEAGTGASSSTGQGGVGSGTGAGGTGTGRGSGAGAGAASAPPRLVRHLTRGDYRQLTAGRMRSGRAGVAIRVNTNGRVDSCRVHISSGDSRIDSGLCPLIRSRLVFQPARDAQGRPVAVDTHYMATWSR